MARRRVGVPCRPQSALVLASLGSPLPRLRPWELGYVDWDTAVRLLHDMSTDEIPWDIAALLEMARSSARRVSSELGEMHPDERGGLL